MQGCVYDYELVAAAALVAESLSCFFFSFGSNYRERERERERERLLFSVSNQACTAVATLDRNYSVAYINCIIAF